MNIVIAPDSYKESLTAIEVADIIEAGFKEIFPDAKYMKVPIADGGEGTALTLVAATHGQLIYTQVANALGHRVEASFGALGDSNVCVIEVAAAVGLDLIPVKKRNPKTACSFGVGELIIAALDTGCRNMIIGLGGSATNDGGAGMLRALGVKFIGSDGLEIAAGGAALKSLTRIDITGIDTRLRETKFRVACDVDNPLIGKNGASAVFGPQKGASSEDVALLDSALEHYGTFLSKQSGKDVLHFAGAGAAGGLGAAFLAILDAQLLSGFQIVAEATELERHIAKADLVVTGEGRMDGQTIYGKAPIGVAKLSKKYGLPVIGIAGSTSHDVKAVYAEGIDAVFSTITHPCTLSDALENAAQNLRTTARNIAAILAMTDQVRRQ